MLDVRAAALPEALVELLPLGLRQHALPDRREPLKPGVDGTVFFIRFLELLTAVLGRFFVAN